MENYVSSETQYQTNFYGFKKGLLYLVFKINQDLLYLLVLYLHNSFNLYP